MVLRGAKRPLGPWKPAASCLAMLAKGGASLASTASPATASLAAALVTPTTVVTLGAASLVLVRAPAIPLVLRSDLLERLLHGKCNLLDGMGLRDRMGSCN